MSKEPRPHFAWTAAVVAAVAVLSIAAWWLWSRPDRAPTDGSTPSIEGGQGSESASSEAAAEAGRKAAIQEADRAMEADRFQAADELLDRAEEEFGWSEALRATGTRLSLRETAFREALRPIEFRIESLVVGPEDEGAELYARYTIEGVPVFASELLKPTTHEQSVHGGHGIERSHVAVLRTSLTRGASLEIVEPGGIFDSDEVLFGPIPINPLPNAQGGQLDYTDDARVLSVSVSYRPSPFEPGVHVDGRPADPPVDATAAQLFAAITSAKMRDDLEVAATLQARLALEFPDHRDLAFFTESIKARADVLRQNRSTATFTILELAVDPRSNGDDDETTLWATGGDSPAFRASIRTTDGQVLAEAEDARTAPYLIPGGAQPAPAGNVLRVVARGTAPLTLVVKDSSPRFSSRVVGAIDLPVNLSELPQGTGTIVVERQPRVLIQPGSEPNRIRRVVLRWTVTR